MKADGWGKRIGVSVCRRVGVERSAASDPLFENLALSQRFA
jgi:hypothetical protein